MAIRAVMPYSNLQKTAGRLVIDSKKDVGVIAIDLSKAFDSNCHDQLLAKLRAYGCKDFAIILLQPYLSDRFQRVKCNGT